MKITPKKPMSLVAFRAPPDLVEKVRALAQWERERGNDVSEGDVYRAILEFFFNVDPTDRSEGKAS